MLDAQPLAAVLGDPPSASSWPSCSARRSSSPTTRSVQNREGTEQVADALVASASSTATRSSKLLDAVGLRKPEIDVLEEAQWPAI